MKIFRFLIQASNTSFVKKTVNYLADIGYKIDILLVDPINNKLWNFDNINNVNIIDKENIKINQYDYFIDFTLSKESKYDIPTILLNLSIKNNQVSANIFLKEDKGSYIFYSKEIENMELDKTNFNELEDKVSEFFIDGLIYLSRSNSHDFKKTALKLNNDIHDFIKFENLAANLNSYYSELNLNQDVFSIENFCSLTQSVVAKKQYKINLVDKTLVLSKIDIQIFLIYLLSLLNSRKNSLYEFTLNCINDNNEVVSLKKSIHVNLSNSCQELVNNLNSNKFSIFDNKFYPFFSKDFFYTTTKINLYYDIDNNDLDHSLLSLKYNSSLNEIAIGYNPLLSFFDHFDHHLKSFYHKLNLFKQGKILFGELLELEQSYISNYILSVNKELNIEDLSGTIHGKFEEQVIKTPNNIALKSGNVELSYEQLNQRSNQLARYITTKKNIIPDSLVALFLDRSEIMIEGILGVLKSGAGYIPIDTSYPEERIKYILEDTKTSIILTNQRNKNFLKDLILSSNISTEIYCVDGGEEFKQIRLQSKENLEISTKGNNLAYVIYTSGTTGKPKGVMIEHIGVINLAINQGDHFGLYNQKHIKQCLFFANYVFDAHVSEIFTCLVNGHVLHIIDDNTRNDILLLSNYINNNQVDIATIPPALLDLDEVLNLQTLVIAGEKTDKKIIQNYLKHNVNLINAYGPTEGTVCATLSHNLSICSSNIGFPIKNATVYILDDLLKPLPYGSVGELYIGGIGLARGYINNPTLTNEKFISNPFQTANEARKGLNAKLYRSGDLARYLSDGSIEYIGRNDQQIKINGYRIEVGEIENTLLGYDDIKQCAVVVKENNQRGRYLIAYYTKKQDAENQIREWQSILNLSPSEINLRDYKENYSGWLSSYTNEPIEKNAMKEFVQNTVERIKELNPKIILEIGSGNGLILFNIIDYCTRYYATDFSINAITYVQDISKKYDFHNKLLFFCCAADKLPFSELQYKFDTVILNSVVQYFPSIGYLTILVNKLITNIEDSGQIFIGDVRDYRLLECFHYSILDYKTKNVSKSDLGLFIQNEKELLISPEYFLYLKTINSSIKSIEIMPKLGINDNEMNNYRYDVIIHIYKQSLLQDTQLKSVQYKDFVEVFSFEEHISLQYKNKNLLLIKYPNKRILSHYKKCKSFLKDTTDVLTINEESILSISSISSIVKKYGFEAKFYLDITSPIYLNIIIYKDSKFNFFGIEYSESRFMIDSFSNKGNTSIDQPSVQNLNLLKSYLSTKLPHYMIPDNFVQLSFLPITANGKLDLESLPEPEFSPADNYKLPEKNTEKYLCQIWAEVLGIDEEKIGIYDDFFKLGGNSLLSIKLANKINKLLGVTITTSSIYKNNTVDKLVFFIESNIAENQNRTEYEV